MWQFSSTESVWKSKPMSDSWLKMSTSVKSKLISVTWLVTSQCDAFRMLVHFCTTCLICFLVMRWCSNANPQSIEYLNISQGKAILHIYWYTVDICDNHLEATTSLWLQTWVVAIGYLCTHQTWFCMIAQLDMKCKHSKYKIETK